MRSRRSRCSARVGSATAAGWRLAIADTEAKRSALKAEFPGARAWIGLLKTNGRLVRRSPLTTVVELEYVRMGVTGKVALWESLKQTELGDQFDFDELLERASRQLKALQVAHHVRASVIGRQRAAKR